MYPYLYKKDKLVNILSVKTDERCNKIGCCSFKNDNMTLFVTKNRQKKPFFLLAQRLFSSNRA